MSMLVDAKDNAELVVECGGAEAFAPAALFKVGTSMLLGGLRASFLVKLISGLIWDTGSVSVLRSLQLGTGCRSFACFF